ncbi:MAG: hypothetical protein AB2689_05445 [Candidatus Thiodiazotropha taylori]
MMPTESDETKELIRTEVKKELFKILREWGILVGATNVAVIVGAVVYVFFILPNSAAQEAKSQINSEIVDLKSDVIKKSSEALVELGKVLGSVEQTKVQLNTLRQKFDITSKDLESVKNEVALIQDPNRADYAKLLKTLSTSGDARTILVNQDHILKELNEWRNELGALSKASKYILSSTCPSGWQDNGTVGIIIEDVSYGHNPFGRGGKYIDGWTWIHPRLCVRQ